MTRTIGTSVYGLRAPIVKQGDDLVQIIVDTVLNSGLEIKDRDVLGITESIVARCQGNYVTIDEVAEEIKQLSNNAKAIAVFKPIYSRNRFAMILKAIARAMDKVTILLSFPSDEVGNGIMDENWHIGIDLCKKEARNLCRNTLTICWRKRSLNSPATGIWTASP